MLVHREVLVLDQSYRPISLTSVKKAVTLAFRDKVEFVEIADSFLRSPSSTYPLPLVIRIKNNVKFKALGKIEPTRRNLFKRDGFECAYCGSKHDLTVDHVIPKSRGGVWNWDNLVTACHSCNNKKDNRTPDEAGMKLSVRPRTPHHVAFMLKSSRIHDKWKPYLYMS